MITLEDIRAEQAFSPSQEPRVARIIKGTIALWERQSGRLWNRRTSYDQLWTLRTPNQRRSSQLFTKLKPIEALTLIEWDLNQDEAQAAMLNPDGDDYQLIADQGKVIRSDSAPWRYFVKATYDGGYIDGHQASPPIGAAVVPDDVLEALIIQVVFSLRRHDGDKVVMAEQAFEAGTARYLSADVHPVFLKAAKARRRRAYAASG